MNKLPESPISRWLLVPRDRAGGKIAGVCSAWAAQHRVDPLVVRVILATLVLASGLGAVVYGTIWALTPDTSGGRAPIDRFLPQLRETNRELVEIAAAIFLALYAMALMTFTPSTTVVVVVVIIVAVAMQRSRNNQGPNGAAAPEAQGYPPEAQDYQETASLQDLQRPSSATSTETTPDSPTAAPDEKLPDSTLASSAQPADSAMDLPLTDVFFSHPDPVGLYGSAPASLSAASAKPEVKNARKGPSWYLGWATIVAIIAWFSYVGFANAAVSAGDAGGLTAVSDTQCWSVAFGISAIGLILGSLVGKPHWLFALTLLLGIITGGSFAPSPTYVVPQDVNYVYSANEELQSEFDIRMGDGVIDLRELKLETEKTVRISADFGDLKVLLPKDQNTTVNYDIRMGEFLAGPLTKSGMELSDSWHRTGTGPKLTLDISVKFGQVTII